MKILSLTRKLWSSFLINFFAMFAWHHRDELKVWAKSLPVLAKSSKQRKRAITEFRVVALEARRIDLQRRSAHLAKSNLQKSVERVEESLAQPSSRIESLSASPDALMGEGKHSVL